jgi:hypothetical protein
MRQRDEAIECLVVIYSTKVGSEAFGRTPHPPANCSQSVSHLCGCRLNINNARVLDGGCCATGSSCKK